MARVHRRLVVVGAMLALLGLVLAGGTPGLAQ